MEVGTSDFESWLNSVKTIARDRPLVPALDLAAKSADTAYGATLWFGEILGRRWSYIAGQRNDAPSGAEMEHISLDDTIGVVANGWGGLSERQSGAFVGFLRELVSARRTS